MGRIAAFVLVTLALTASACHPCLDGTISGFVMVTDGEILVVTSFDHGGTKWGTLEDTPLTSCREISGNLDIDGHISTLDAFNNLERIGGSLTISVMHGVEDIDGFPALREVAGIRLTDNLLREWLLEAPGGGPPVRPQRISGFNSLTELRGDLYIGRTRIRDVTGFESLRHIGGSFWPWYSPLSNLEGMKNLETIGGNVMAWSTGADFRSLSQLTSIGGSLDIYGLGARGTLGLVSLREIGGAASLTDVANLPDIGMPALERVGALYLNDLDGLTDMIGLDALTHIRGDVGIAGNRELPSERVYSWIEERGVVIDGDIIVCENQERSAEPCPPPPAQ